MVARCYLYLDGKEVLFEETVLGDFARTNNKLDTITTHLTVEDIFGEEETNNNSILKALSDCPISDIGEEVKNVEISAFFGDISDNKILKNLSEKGSTLNTLSTDINALTMKDIFGEDEVNNNKILKNLADTKIDGLPSAINDLSVEDILHDDIYNLDAAGNYVDKNGVNFIAYHLVNNNAVLIDVIAVCVQVINIIV